MIEVREAVDGHELGAVLALRRAVFVVEQHVPPEMEVDEHDDAATHLVALDGRRIVGTCRLLADGDRVRLGRLAVDAAARRRGVAGALLDHGERWARARGAAEIVLAAQTEARPLYEHAGYVARGEPFMEAGIEHVMMHRPLV